jgi:hypothetical protein
MRGFNGLKTILILVVVAALMFAAFVSIPQANCTAEARAMGVGYYFHPLDGCFLQNSAGDYYRVDQVTINQP